MTRNSTTFWNLRFYNLSLSFSQPLLLFGCAFKKRDGLKPTVYLYEYFILNSGCPYIYISEEMG